MISVRSLDIEEKWSVMVFSRTGKTSCGDATPREICPLNEDSTYLVDKPAG